MLYDVRVETKAFLYRIRDLDMPRPIVEIGPTTTAPCLEHNINSRNLFDDYYSFDLAKADIIGDATKIDKVMGKGTVGSIIALNVLEHIPNLWDIPQAFYNVLKSNGKVFALTPFYLRFHGPRPDCWRITDDGYHALFDSLFDVRIIKDDQTLRPATVAAIMKKKCKPS